MLTSINQHSFKLIFMVILLSIGGFVKGQSAADQTFKAIPQQIKDNSENKASNKAITTSNKALDKMDTLSDKAVKKITGLFKKKDKAKNKNIKTDSTGVNPPDSLSVHPKATSAIRYSKFFSNPV